MTLRAESIETRVARRLNQLHDQGVIATEVLLLFGISGDLPEFDPQTGCYYTLQHRQSILRERMEKRFGKHWQRRFPNAPIWLREAPEEPDWIEDGF